MSRRFEVLLDGRSANEDVRIYELAEKQALGEEVTTKDVLKVTEAHLRFMAAYELNHGNRENARKISAVASKCKRGVMTNDVSEALNETLNYLVGQEEVNNRILLRGTSRELLGGQINLSTPRGRGLQRAEDAVAQENRYLPHAISALRRVIK